MDTYPVFLNLRGKTCLVVGAGQVGQRKILRLLESRPDRLFIVDPWLSEDLASTFAAQDNVTVLRRDFRPQDLGPGPECQNQRALLPAEHPLQHR